MQEKSIYKEPWFYIMVVVLIITTVIAGFLIYKAMTKPVEVQGTSQTIAETPTGVKITAEKAGYNITNGQAKEIATVIREIRTENKEPAYVITTTGKEAKTQAEQAKKDNKADFAIVTDKNDPNKQVDLDKLEKEKPVELNQYNIQSYKPVIRTLSVSPDFKDSGIKQVNFTISKKVTKDGQYMGVGVGYDIKDKRVLMNVSYSW